MPSKWCDRETSYHGKPTLFAAVHTVCQSWCCYVLAYLVQGVQDLRQLITHGHNVLLERLHLVVLVVSNELLACCQLMHKVLGGFFEVIMLDLQFNGACEG